jgi:hypothetical protein
VKEKNRRKKTVGKLSLPLLSRLGRTFSAFSTLTSASKTERDPSSRARSSGEGRGSEREQEQEQEQEEEEEAEVDDGDSGEIATTRP